MPLAVALIVLVVGSLVFHFLSPWTFTPIASHWGMIDTTVDITFVVTGIVFVAVNLFMAYAIIRFRHKEGARAKYEPENKKLEIWLTVADEIDAEWNPALEVALPLDDSDEYHLVLTRRKVRRIEFIEHTVNIEFAVGRCFSVRAKEKNRLHRPAPPSPS